MLDFNKPIQARNGTQVKIYNKDAGGTMCVHGAFVWGDGECTIQTWSAEGVYQPGQEGALDLVNVSVEREMYINMYPESYDVHGYATREEADEEASGYRLGCIKVTLTEGQYDD